MSKIVVDEALRAKLNGLTEGTEFCAPDGKPLGYFVTVADYMDLLYARTKERFTPEQVESLRQQQGGRSLKEIMRDLERQ
jgi:hypothetical protein